MDTNVVTAGIARDATIVRSQNHLPGDRRCRAECSAMSAATDRTADTDTA